MYKLTAPGSKFDVHDYEWPTLEDCWGFLGAYRPDRPDAGTKVWAIRGPGISVLLRFK